MQQKRLCQELKWTLEREKKLKDITALGNKSLIANAWLLELKIIKYALEKAIGKDARMKGSRAYCPDCGTNIRFSDNYCRKCGQKLAICIKGGNKKHEK